jgi:hypothetical protein
MMVETMGRTDTPKESIENLLRVKQLHFIEQPISWEYLLNKFAQPSRGSISGATFQERMRYLITCCLSSRVEAIGLAVLRDRARETIYTTKFNQYDGNDGIAQIQEKFDHIENELQVFGSIAVSPVELMLSLDVCCHIFSCLQWIKNQTQSFMTTMMMTMRVVTVNK